jgi:multidrug efflux system outer membrane protein
LRLPLFRDRQPDHDENHSSPRVWRSPALAFALTLLTGCALIQDDPGQVPLVNPQQAELAQVIHLANSGWPTARWWEGYQDPQLNMLVNRALQNSPTMQAARLRISQSQSTVELAQSAMGVRPPPWRRKTACG